jgi:uncharacterized protein YbjT (DUF2867 family)
MAPPETLLVTGATGNTGSALLQLLEQRGAAVRAMVRRETDAARLGSTSTSIVVADFGDTAAIAAALRGVRCAYLVTPSSADAERQQMQFAELAAEAGVRHLVKLSQFAADASSRVRFLRYHAAVEQHIQKLGIGYTFLRPNLFFQGLLAVRQSIAKDGRFFAPIGEARISAVDVRDIAAVTAVVMTQSGHLGKTYTITGPAAITHAEIATALGKALGRDVGFVDVTPDAFVDALQSCGVPAWQVEGLVEDYAHYARGEAARVYPTVEEVTHRKPRDIASFARDYAAVFRS